MRILINTPYLGGAGGLERAVWSIAHALSEDDVHIVAGHHLGGPLGSLPPGVTLNSRRDWRWRGAWTTSGPRARWIKKVVNPVRKHLLHRYDALLTFPHTVDLSDFCRARVRLLIPAGAPVLLPRSSFDLVALEAPDNDRLMRTSAPTVLLPPPYVGLSRDRRPPQQALPTRFFLTVFNPHDPVKGADDLLWAADTAPHPIVWCHSSRTVTFQIDEDLARHPNIVHIDDASPAELRHLYENCEAYLMFSRSEGFGWAAVDALAYSPLVVSRVTGIFSFAECPHDGVMLLGDDWRVDWDDVATHPRAAQRNLEWLAAPRFRERLMKVIAQYS